jgi:UDP-N-acetylglucosamine--N-acetylmuramyl-(pentapeptide) pyrophosphoryl-undecaprenol N-acetylglucosamine transferase
VWRAAAPTAMDAPWTVVVAGGGTGGHLYPGIAVAREIVRRWPSARVTFAGTARGLEARVVPREGFELDLVRSSGLKGRSIASRLRGLAVLAPGAGDAWRILSRRRPRAVIGVGGYSSGLVVLFAAVRGIPTLVLEQNAVPGLTNRLLARVVRAAAVNFEPALRFFHGRGFVAGNPVRAEFFTTGADDDASTARVSGRGPRVLTLGGSQGAHAINLAVVAAAARLVQQLPSVEFVHQTGERDLDAVRAGYAASVTHARAEAFFDPVAPEMKAADLVVSRAGATTLAELAASGRPAILVPFPFATDDHQMGNARVLEAAGAAVVIAEKDLTAETLAAQAARLLSEPATLRSMSIAMRTFARPDAARRVVDRLSELLPRDTVAAGASGAR